MTRKYMNERWCVRCNRRTPTPYLRENVNLVKGAVVDIGCGNGRNTEFLISRGFFVIPLDMVGDYGTLCILGKERFPIKDGTIGTFLANYLFMFLNPVERRNLIDEIHRTSMDGSVIFVELYPAKDSLTPDDRTMMELQGELIVQIGWNVIKCSKGRFIAKRDDEDPNLIPCTICGKTASFERNFNQEPHEGEVCDECGEWVCDDCVDYTTMDRLQTENPICVECGKGNDLDSRGNDRVGR